MPILSRLEIIDVAERILEAAGASAANAAIVAHHLADANMTGHDSHGLIRVPQYVDDIRAGHCDPGAEPEVASESGAVVRVDGHHSFGQVVAEFGTERAMEKARELGLGMATMGSLGHVGRIGSYGERAARDDMAAIMFTGLLGERAQCAPPHGGLARRFSTNPVSITFPYQSDGPLVLDFATSVGAEGKLRVYRARGQDLPDEWLLDANGKPSRDPNDFYAGGAVLPLGGLHGGHKGYALAFMTAVLGGIVGELGQPDPPEGGYTSGSTIIVIDTSRLGPADDLRAEVEGLVRHAKDTPLMPGVDEILVPGEKEARSRRQRLAAGVEIENATWDQIDQLAREYDIDLSRK